jgi:SAM-dependent methyltransferase
MSEAEHWEARYREGSTPWETGRPSSELQRVVAAHGIAPCRAIDLGCGMGMHSIWLASQGFDVTGVDISPHALADARKRASDASVSVNFLAADLTAPPPELQGPFDFVFDRGCYHVIRRAGEGDAYLRTLAMLSHAGTLALHLTGNAKEPGNPGPPVVSEAELRAEIGSLFDIIELREFRFDPTPTLPDAPLAWSCFSRRRGDGAASEK